MIRRSFKTLAITTSTLWLLTACGGGSSDSGPAQPTPAPPPPTPVPDQTPADPLTTSNGLVFFGSATATTGESLGFAVRREDGSDLDQVTWQQVQGPQDLVVLASHTQAIGFDVNQAGDYAFDVSTVNDAGVSRSARVEFTVLEGTAPEANIRLDHAATERGRVSLRVDTNPAKTVSDISWEQLAGPLAQNVTLNDDNLNFVFFDAPAVTTDSVIAYEATVTYTDQSTAVDTAIVMVKNDTINESAYFPNSDLIVTDDMFAYRADSPYASAIERCVYTNTLASTCRFSELPLIGQVTEQPTVEDILDRTLVSHAWMGQRFEEFLRSSAAGPDMLQLLRATTAIVISYEVRPSFYWTATGAIYLDGNNFWQTPAERDTLNDRPDFRSDFGNQLQFIIPWRYVKNNDYYPAGRYPQADRLQRTFEDVEASISWLMYHELGHANDFFPSSSWAGLSPSDDPLSSFRENGTLSDTIPTSLPLRSDQMKALAQVSFAGETPSTTQRNYNGADVESFFEPDVSPSYYSYLNEREDFATLFERFMMLYRLGASNDVAVIETVNNDDLIVTWGQRDRINEANIVPRVRYAVENILPELDFNAIQSQLPAPILMDPTKSWFDNVVLGEQLQRVGERELRIVVPRRIEDELFLPPDKTLPLPDEQN